MYSAHCIVGTMAISHWQCFSRLARRMMFRTASTWAKMALEFFSLTSSMSLGFTPSSRT